MEIIDDPAESFARLETDLKHMIDWAAQWRIIFNALKTVYMVFSRKLVKPHYPPLFMGNSRIRQVATHKHLGFNLSETLSWDGHLNAICKKANQRIGILKRLSKLLFRRTKETVYQTFIRPILEYGAVIYDGCPQFLVDKLEGVQRQAALACTGAYLLTSHESLLIELGWVRLAVRRECQKLFQMYKMQNGLVPVYLANLSLQAVNTNRYSLRRPNHLIPPRCRTSAFMKSFLPSSIRLWNGLDPPMRALPTLSRFKAHIKRSRYKNRNTLYWEGNDYGSLNHSRMRMGLSALNQQRKKYNFIETSTCPKCLAPREDICHFFFTCPRYTAHRLTLFANLAPIPIIPPSSPAERASLSQTFLFGTPAFSQEENRLIFRHVQAFIKHTRRF
jgi:hypothetical protein